MGSFAIFVSEGTTTARNDEIVAALLICLVVSIILSVLIMRRIIRAERKRRKHQWEPAPVLRASAAAFVEAPTRWLAVRAADLHTVQNALAVQNVRSCAWCDAVVTAYDAHLFISPPVRGWVLVMGCDLPDPIEDVDECFIFLTRLSEKLGDVQYFVRNRAVSHHGWVKMEAGKVVRAYMWTGETVWNQGIMTPAEKELKLRCLPYNESPDVLGFGERDLLAVNTERVIRLAGEWSVDPTSVEADTLDGKGITGDLLHSKFH